MLLLKSVMSIQPCLCYFFSSPASMCRIFPYQGSSLCPLLQKWEFEPLDHEDPQLKVFEEPPNSFLYLHHFTFLPAMHSILISLHPHQYLFFSFYYYYLFFKFIYFNWRLITLQYCGGFAIHSHELAMSVHVFCMLNPLPLPSPSHPSGSSQCTSPEHPVSCIEPGPAICFTYDNIHVSMLFSQILPPSPSPRVQKSVLYICFFCYLTYRVIVTIFLKSIYMR